MPNPIVVAAPQAKGTLNTILNIGLTIGAGVIIYKGYGAYKDWAEKKAKEKELVKDQKSTVQPKKGKIMFDLKGAPTKSANLASIALAIQNNLHPGWNKFTKQDDAIREFKNTPMGFVKQLEQIYLDKYGITLQQDFKDKLSEENWIKIKYFFDGRF